MTPERAVEFDSNDLALIVYAAKAFNMGLTPRSDRAPETKEGLDIAIERVGRVVGIEMRRGPHE